MLASTLVRPYVSHHAIGIVWIIVALAALVIELSGAFRRRSEATNRDRGSQIVLRLCTIPAVIVLIYSPRILPSAEMSPPLVWAIAGIAVFAAGEALRVWAKTALGRYFTYTVQTSADQPVVTSGPYRVLRHPSYTGILLIAIGIGSVEGNWLGLGVLAVMTTVGLMYRIRVEEKALLQDLGERYRAYAEHHKRLIPFVW
jgi:protein-S-isoprenylcysteine O-methyltransferase Ste14